MKNDFWWQKNVIHLLQERIISHLFQSNLLNAPLNLIFIVSTFIFSKLFFFQKHFSLALNHCFVFCVFWLYNIIAFLRHKNYTQLVSNNIRNYQINQINSLSPNRVQVIHSLQKYFFYCRYKRLLIHTIVQFYGISLALLKFMRRIFITRKKERKGIPFNRDCCFERKSKRLYSSGLDICTHTHTQT